MKQILQAYVTSELKIKLFCFFNYTRHNTSFRSYEKQIFKYFGCTTNRKDSKWTKTRRNEVMQTATTRRLERLIFHYTPIIVGSWKCRFKIFEFKCLISLLEQIGMYSLNKDTTDSHLLETTSMPLLLLSMPRHPRTFYYRRFLEI